MVITDENQLYEQWSRKFRKSWERLFRHTREQHMFVCSSVYATVIRIYYVILQGRLLTYLQSSCARQVFLLYTRAEHLILITLNFQHSPTFNCTMRSKFSYFHKYRVSARIIKIIGYI